MPILLRFGTRLVVGDDPRGFAAVRGPSSKLTMGDLRQFEAQVMWEGWSSKVWCWQPALPALVRVDMRDMEAEGYEEALRCDVLCHPRD